MGIWRHLGHGLRALLRRDEVDRDISDEVRHWMDEAEAELVSGGASPEDARRTVRSRHGDGSAAREAVRSYGWERVVASLYGDLRHAERRLRRSPGFTVVAVLTLGIGIGASTAIFSVVRPVLFEPLAYPHPERLFSISDRGADGSPIPVTFGTYRELVERSRSFEAISVGRPWQPTVTGGGEPERLTGELVTADHFRVLGVAPALGGGFDPADDHVGGPHVVVLSDAIWRRRFGGDSTIVGRSIRLDGQAFTVMGVMPRSFEGVPGRPAEAWALLQYDASLPSFDGREWGHHLRMVGRVAPGVAPEAAVRELDRIAASPIRELARPPWASMEEGLDVRGLVEAATADARPVLLALLGAVALLLGIASVNVTNLVLARGARRRGEMAMRAALGAGRGRLARQLVTESLLLAAIGCALGLGVARAGIDVLMAVSPPELPRAAAIGLDGGAFIFALGVTTLVGVAVGLAPAAGLRKGTISQDVRDAGGRTVAGHLVARRTLVVAEVALALVLLVGAGLLLRSTRRVLAVTPGFDPAHVVVMQIQVAGPRYDDAATHRFFALALDAVRAVPGVASAGLTSQLPLSGQADVYGIRFDQDDLTSETASETGHGAFRYVVSPGYLATMRIPLVRGRALDARDAAGAPQAVIVDEAFARSAFPGSDPLGRRVRVGSASQWATIVGVAGTVKQTSLGADGGDAFYVTPEQWYFADRASWLVVRAGGDAATLVPAVKSAVWSVDPDQPIVRISTMEGLVRRSEAQRRFALGVLEAFALLALVLAAIGLYGVLSGSVGERTREIGVRAALGASRERILRLVVRQGMTLTALGIAIGLAGAGLASRTLVTLLFGVSRLDPLTYAGVVAVLAAVAALACWVPASRAARVDPVSTLRVD